jgi:hypothetical protein
MRKVEFAAGQFYAAQADPWACIVGLRLGSGKIVSHAWREQFVADNQSLRARGASPSSRKRTAKK